MSGSSISLLLVLLFFSLAISATRGDDDGAALETEAPVSSLPPEVEHLKSKISALELSIAHQNEELKRKDGNIAEVEKLIKKKSDAIFSLQREIETIQKKGAVDAAELVEEAHARSATLEKQIEKLKGDLQMQSHNKDTLEARAAGAEKKIKELTSMLSTLERMSVEQKQRIQKTERLLKVAEEELMKAKSEAASKKRELAEIHGAWLPTWLATHLEYYVGCTITQWNHYGKPALDDLSQKAFKLSAQAQKYAEPHLESAKEKLLPAMKEQWISFSTFMEPHLQQVAAKIVDYYEVSLTTLRPHVVRVQELANPYYLEAKKFSKPYIDQVASATKPHVEKVRIALKPYTKKAVHTYGKFLKSATSYHHQVQTVTREKLKKYEITKAFATKELVWFLASAFLALPIYLLYVTVGTFFCKKPKKQTRNSPENGTHRRHKRRHAEK